MPRKVKYQRLSKPYPLRMSLDCEKAWKFLSLHKLRPSYYMRLGGEQKVIEIAEEYMKRNKRIPNAPAWLYD